MSQDDLQPQRVSRAVRACLTTGLAAVLMAGCASHSGSGAPAGTVSSSPSSSLVPATTPPTHAVAAIVSLGDSVPAGAACRCKPYPQLSASDLSMSGLRRVTTHNFAVDGYTTEDVIHQVFSDHLVMRQVGLSNALEVEIGANDVPYSDACGTTANCYTAKVSQLETNLLTIVNRIHELTAVKPVTVALLDYWSVWLGGQYAQERGEAYVAAAAEVTNDVDLAIKNVAARTGSRYVDLRAAFKGPDYAYDETHYLAGDGDHPNAAGHQKIASAVAEVLQAGPVGARTQESGAAVKPTAIHS
jgi:acyl-CoA thioesterase I